MRPTARCSDHLLRTVQLAGREAADLAAPALGTEHLLLALLVGEAGGGLLAVAPEDLRALLPRARPTSGVAAVAAVPAFSRRAVAAVHAARRLAEAREDREVGVDHLLAAVLGDPDCAAVAALERLGIDVGDLWSRAVADLGSAGRVAVLR